MSKISEKDCAHVQWWELKMMNGQKIRKCVMCPRTERYENGRWEKMTKASAPPINRIREDQQQEPEQKSTIDIMMGRTSIHVSSEPMAKPARKTKRRTMAAKKKSSTRRR